MFEHNNHRHLYMLLFVTLSHLCCSAHASDRPNVVFILADDLGWSDTTLHGTTQFYQTPNIQRLAARGMMFTRAYSASPLCSPTRSAILTGLSPARTGITNPNCHRPELVLKAKAGSKAPKNKHSIQPVPVTRLKTDYPTIAKSLKRAGYATGHFGKWHLGREPYSPLQHGFDVDVPHWPGPGPAGSFVAPWKFDNFDHDPDVPDQHIEDRMASEAVSFIEQHKDEPFFLNYWMFSVHAPFDAKEELIEKYRKTVDPKNPQRCPTYAAMIESMDDAVGTLLDTLDRLKLTDNTIIIFTSDNGGNMYNRVEGESPTSNAPLKGGKASMFEGGTRVPLVVAWPELTQPATTNDTIVQSEDFYPTLLGGLGLEPEPNQQFDGVSFLPSLKGEPISREAVFQYFPHDPPVPDWIPPSISVHQGDWKLIRVFHAGQDGGHRYHLFNLVNDIGENENLAEANPEMVARLDSLITEFLNETNAVTPIANPNFDPASYRPELEGIRPANKFRERPRRKKKASKGKASKKEVSNDRKMENRLSIGDGKIKVGIDRDKGGAISWLSSSGYPKNMVNIADPGRLIQQSYYAGQRIDRTADGQRKSWSPWAWNPVQGGGVGAAGGSGTWAVATKFERRAETLYSETVPKLWDMVDEDADALMRQWTALQPQMTGVVVVQCEIETARKPNDRWATALNNPQEIPACYFTRNFSDIRSYLGNGKWKQEIHSPGPPWGKTTPPMKAMALFERGGQGVAIFSPAAKSHWNFGPHAGGQSSDPAAGPCMHIAPIDRAALKHRSTYRYRYWLVVGSEPEIAERLDSLRKLAWNEKSELSSL
jgi:arylsulfatase A-like enzyme